MVLTILAVAAVVGLAQAGVPLGYSNLGGPLAHTYAAPVAYAPAPIATRTIIAEPAAPAHYDYGYAVSDPLTGDSKTQHESRRGDIVQGSYSLIDADGTRRTVDYTADAINGFNAVVRKEPVIVKRVAAAPVAYASAPAVSYAAHAPRYY